VVAAVVFGVAEVDAQTVCDGQPWLGTNGPEVCVEIRDEETLDTYRERFQGTGGTVNRTVGTWRVNLTFTYAIGDGGMSMTIEGEVWREFPGSGWLSARGEGGTNVPIHVDTGSLWLDGTATATSGTVVGGAYGIRHPGGDVEFIGFPVVVEQTTLGPGAFHGERDEIPVDAEVVAVGNTTGFHVNEVGDLIDIPSGGVCGVTPAAIDPLRRMRSITLSNEFVPWETRLVAVPGRQDSDLVVASLRSSRTQDHFDAFGVSPPFEQADVIPLGEVDQADFMFSLHKGILLPDGRPLFAYVKGEATGLNLWTATFNGRMSHTTQQVQESVGDDYHSVTAFNTADGSYLKAFNFTDRTIDIFKLAPGGVFELFWVLRDLDLGGLPGGMADAAAIGKADGDVGTSTAVITVGMVDGSLTVAEIDPEANEVTNLWTLGEANGETSVDLSFDGRLGTYRVSVDWLNADRLWHSRWDLGDPSSESRIEVATLEPGTLLPYQGVSGAWGRDGFYHLFADNGYEIMGDGTTVSELPSYSFDTMGGPVDLITVDDPSISGFASGPGSLRLGILKAPPPVSELSVPAVARVWGAGAFFTSLIHLFSGGDSDLELELTFTPRAGSGGSVETVEHTVPAREMQTIEDPLATLFGFTGSAGRVGSIMVETLSGSTSDLMVQTVVFAELDSGEKYGQFFPAMRASDAINAGQKAYLNTTEDPSLNRVNIGLMAVTDGTQFRVTPVDPLGTGLAAAKTYSLDIGGNTQINNIHSTFGLGTMADVVVEVEVLSGRGLAYASVLDGSGSYQGTSDPTTILPVLGGSERMTLLEIGSIQGVNEFSGSASITNYSGQPAEVQAQFFQRGESGAPVTRDLTIAAGDTVGYTDLGADLFGVSGDVGTVVLTTTNGTEIGATGREFAIFRDAQNRVVGTAGQLIAGQTDGDRLDAGRVHHFIGLRQERGGSAVERSHFAVFNPATTDARVTVRLYDGATGVFEGEGTWTVGTKTLIQVNNVIRAINPDHDGNEKRIEVEVNRRVFMNAFRVNRWGDPVTLSPFPG
jgi:hypothetical protein